MNNRWAGVALGDAMANADFYIGWKNSSGGYTLSRRTPNGYSMPEYSSSNQIVNVVPLQVPSPSWASLAFSFTRPIAADNTITSSSRFIYGIANNPPANPDDPGSSFIGHSQKGNLPAANFLASSGGSVSTGSGSSAIVSSTREVYEKVMTAHGALFFIAWVLAPFVGIFIARYLKATLGPLWYKLHMGILGGVTGGLSVIGFLLAVLYNQGKHFARPHQVMLLFDKNDCEFKLMVLN
jgi:hypothetical protein